MTTKTSSTTGSTPKKKRTVSARSPDSVAIDKIRAAISGLSSAEALRVIEYVAQPMRDVAYEEAMEKGRRIVGEALAAPGWPHNHSPSRPMALGSPPLAAKVAEALPQG